MSRLITVNAIMMHLIIINGFNKCHCWPVKIMQSDPSDTMLICEWQKRLPSFAKTIGLNSVRASIKEITIYEWQKRLLSFVKWCVWVPTAPQVTQLKFASGRSACYHSVITKSNNIPRSNWRRRRKFWRFTIVKLIIISAAGENFGDLTLLNWWICFEKTSLKLKSLKKNLDPYFPKKSVKIPYFP